MILFTFYLVIGAFDSIYYAQYIIDSSYLFHTSFTTIFFVITIPFYLIILKKKKTKKKMVDLIPTVTISNISTSIKTFRARTLIFPT